MIGIVNYGMGNLASVKNALDYLGIPSRIICLPLELTQVDKILLPGVGAFGMAMENLRKTGFSDIIQELVVAKQMPILGVCLGMQLLLESSCEHGYHEGLKIIGGQVRYFGDSTKDLPIPHIGWNDVERTTHSTLFDEAESSASYYFVHSYYCDLSHHNHVAGITHYGIAFHSALEHNNVFGCQFHPEKSQKNGLALLKQFDAV